MTNPRPSSRRSGWVALLAATGVVLGGAFAVRRNRRKREERHAKATEPSRPLRADGPAAADPGLPGVADPGRPGVAAPGRSDVSWSPVRLAVAAAMIVVLAAVAAMAMRLSGTDRTALSNERLQPDSPAGRLVDDLPLRTRTPVRSEPPVPTKALEPSAEVVVDSLSSDGVACASGTAHSVLNTVRPVLTARMAAPGPAGLELKRENAVEFASVNTNDLTSEGGHVTLYLRGASRLQAGESYRWRVRGTATTDWSPWCRFTIAATTLDSLNLDEDRLLTAGLPPSRWRDIAAVLGPGWPHGDTPWYWSIQEAGSRVSAGEVPVSLRGWDWETVIESIAEWASARNDPELWRLVDVLSAKLGGPPHPTLGFRRA